MTEARPFQFRLKHLLLVTLWCAGLFGVGSQLREPVTLTYIVFSLWGAILWFVCVRKPENEARIVSIFLLIALPVGLVCILPAFQPYESISYESETGRSCLNNLKQIGLALHIYHEEYDCFPPAYIADETGRPMHSWRVLILPFIDQGPLYELYRFDEPWDGPNNRKLHGEFVDAFACPIDPGGIITDTSYVAVVGSDTVWPGQECTSMKDIADGNSNTIMLVEVAGSGIHWMEPRDLPVEGATVKPKGGAGGLGISGGHTGGFNCLFVDGSARTITRSIQPETLQALLTIDGGEPLDGGPD